MGCRFYTKMTFLSDDFAFECIRELLDHCLCLIILFVCLFDCLLVFVVSNYWYPSKLKLSELLAARLVTTTIELMN